MSSELGVHVPPCGCAGGLLGEVEGRTDMHKNISLTELLQ